jgi:predicted O-linked N-acetylglucosamine transferase (SPINDLY family)
MTQSADPQKLQAAFSLHQAGKLDQAADLYRQIISRDHRNFPALHYLGLIEATRGNYQQAKALLERSLSIEPPNLQFMENYATILFQTGSYEAALQTCQRGFKLNPGNVALLYVAAISLFKLERLQESLVQFDRLLLVAPNHLAAINERGGVLAKMKQYDSALVSFDKALTLHPQYADAYLAKGNVFGALKRYDEAVTSYDSALALKPDMAEAWLGRGNIFRALGHFKESLVAFDKALSLNSGLTEAWLGRGNALFELRHYDGARAAFAKAISLRPDFAEAWLGRGNVDCVLARLDEALAAYDKVLTLKPDSADASIGRGVVLGGRRKFDDAVDAIDRGLALKPDSREGWLARGRMLFETNRIAEAVAAYDKALLVEPDFADAISSRVFAVDFLTESDFATQQEARNLWWQKIGSPIAERSQAHYRDTADPDRRLKVGYVSSDFRQHSAARCFLPMLGAHDKARFEIACYSCSIVEDDVTREFEALADHWRNVAQLSDDELSKLIQADEIDILVDLSGHTGGNRLTVFAGKPAPVQVSAGATGTGIPKIDYLFSDKVTCPPDVRHLFAEKIYDLPSIMTIEPLPYQIPISRPPVLSNGYVTFGVFNRVSKISDDVVSLWARILHAVPGSKLLIKDFALAEAAMRVRQLGRFAAHGIAAERIAFLGATSHQEHLAAFKEVDISLDPFPQNGGISALESLQMGVPLVTLLGNGISSRAAGSILSSVGMNEWVAGTPDNYLAIATKFAAMPDHLEALRPALPGKVAQSAVGDAAIYTKAVETAYRTMWAEYCRTAVR